MGSCFEFIEVMQRTFCGFLLKNSKKHSLLSSESSLQQEINVDVWQDNKRHSFTQIEKLVENIIVEIEKLNGYHLVDCSDGTCPKLERDLSLSDMWSICLEKWTCFEDEEQIVSQVVDYILFELVEEVLLFMLFK
ncbi:hypothetical protein J5N97_004401 [Dioscorea zingiberensis]|uniref:DUF4378 domain-containing protein n=1 Tax=Dioscorea zingiberensis TaxID=325984 RepID=A0A9D5D617_9LILI|nr:hypothetical protein J5N97_004401 [Dioscorea zingiberensis]